MLPFPILFQNNHYIIINKPAGMAVYNTKHSDSNSVEDFFPLLSRRKDGPWLVHRLDQDTAGCLLIALRKQALINAQIFFEKKQVTKIYWAIVEGKPTTTQGLIDAPLLKVTQNNKWSMQLSAKGQPALTQWKLLASNGSISCLELRLLTGRTHQARAHCAILGHPIIGDPIYNPKAQHKIQLQLFSRQISLPFTTVISAIAEPPTHMAALISQLHL